MQLSSQLSGITDELKDSVVFNGMEEIYIKDHKRFREKDLDLLVQRALTHADPQVRTINRWLIRRFALQSGVVPASLSGLYVAKSRKSSQKMTVPALALPGITYESARMLFRTFQTKNCRAFVLEVTPRPELKAMDYDVSVAVALSAALRERYSGPLFLQLAPVVVSGPDEMESSKQTISAALAAGIYNFDLDTSPLMKNSAITIEEQQKPSVDTAAELCEWVKENCPKAIEPFVGLTTGPSNRQNTSVDDLRVFLDALLSRTKCFRRVTVVDQQVDIRTLESWTNLLVTAYRLAGVRLLDVGGFDSATIDNIVRAEVAELRIQATISGRILEEKLKALGVAQTLEMVLENLDAPKIMPPLPEPLKNA
jgi:hypothetical protein